MSLLDGEETIIVYPMVSEGRTIYGTHNLKRGEGVTLEGVVVRNYGAGSLSGLESDNEESVNDQRVITGKMAWPGGPHSIISHNGVEYDQLGLAKDYNRGRRTKHFMVRVKRRSAEVK